MNIKENDNQANNSGFDSNNKQSFFRRRKGCPLSEIDSPIVDYKNIKLLTKFISERGRILPSRITGVSAKKQRELKKAIKRARTLALLPFAQK
jgi:small subunit ribosomal protein S18